MATGIGDVLRTARRERGQTLTDAAQSTRVRETYLAALEQEEFDSLGGDVYVRGFLASYAKFLDLDPDPLLAVYREQHQQRPPERAPGAPRSEDVDHPGRPARPAGALILVVLVVVVMLIVLALGLRDAAAAAALAGHGTV